MFNKHCLYSKANLALDCITSNCITANFALQFSDNYRRSCSSEELPRIRAALFYKFVIQSLEGTNQAIDGCCKSIEFAKPNSEVLDSLAASESEVLTDEAVGSHNFSQLSMLLV